MIDDQKRAEIRRLFFGEHFKIGTIASQLGLHHGVVRREIDTDKLASRGKARPSALDPYIDFMRETLERYPRLTGTRLHQMLQTRGYEGSAIQVRRKIRQLDLRPAPKEAFFRLETLPGEQGQCDWGHFGTIRVGQAERKLFALVIVLSHSRAMHAYFSLDQTLPSVIRGHKAAFEAFGGVPRTILYDNMKTVVLERDGDFIRFHPRFLQLSAHYLFAAHPCRPARGNEKGKVERQIRYLRDSFFAGRHFADLEDVRTQFAQWKADIAHKRKCVADETMTVAQALEAERPKLLSLPIHPIDDADTRITVAKKQPYVVLDTNYYSIPWQLVGKPITVSATEDEVRILHEAEVVARHRRSWDRKQTITDPSHLEGLRDYKRKAQSLTGRALLFDAVPQARVLYQDLQQRNEPLGVHTRRLLGLLEDYGPDAVGRAIALAIERKTPRADSVAYILERDAERHGQPKVTPSFDSVQAGQLTIRNHRLEDYDDI
jgi:transposase